MKGKKYSESGFGKTLTRILLQKNITQKELAEKTGLTDVTICRYCAGTRIPNINKVNLIAKVLGVSPEVLMRYKEDDRFINGISVNKLEELLNACKDRNIEEINITIKFKNEMEEEQCRIF